MPAIKLKTESEADRISLRGVRVKATHSTLRMCGRLLDAARGPMMLRFCGRL